MPAPRRFKQLLKDSLGLLRADAGVYLSLVLLSVLPALALALLVPASRSKEALNAAFDAGDFGTIFVVAAGGLFARLLDSFVGVAAILAAHERDAGGAPRLGVLLARSARAYPGYLMTGLRALLWILGGVVAFIVPGLLMALRYCLIPYAVLLEGLQGDAAMERSARLCKALPGKIYGNLLGGAFSIVIAGTLLTAAMGFLLPESGDEVIAKLVDGLAAVWLAAFTVLLYQDVAKTVE